MRRKNSNMGASAFSKPSISPRTTSSAASFLSASRMTVEKPRAAKSATAGGTASIHCGM